MGKPTGVWIISAAEHEALLAALQSKGGTAARVRLMKEPEVAEKVVALLASIEEERQSGP